jgi:acyl-CoA reductase-like NAD-dependent aldehyde dehydrogenase
MIFGKPDLMIGSDESEITSVYAASADDVDKAVIAARTAFNDPSWRDISGTERGDLLFKLAALIDQHKEVLATIETWDNGSCTLVLYNYVKLTTCRQAVFCIPGRRSFGSDRNH